MFLVSELAMLKEKTDTNEAVYCKCNKPKNQTRSGILLMREVTWDSQNHPIKLGFRAQSILSFNFHFSCRCRPFSLFSSRVKLVYVRLDKFINFSRSFTRPKLLRLTCATGFYLDHFLLRPSWLTSCLRPSWLLQLADSTDHSSRLIQLTTLVGSLWSKYAGYVS